ncbi:MAG: lysine--tRNA ligase [Candidatus Spechtbacterales bacterium]|nr:lysine--tRNA ligase [Candidatus Spechtbacterales bacterium]
MATIDEIIKTRLEKRKKLKEGGANPYPVHVNQTHTTAEALENFSELSKKEEPVKLTGRIMAFRTHGAISFAELKDGSGQIQLAFREDGMGKAAYEEIQEILDRGDFINAEGTLFETKRGEKTLDVKKFDIISKSIRPLPEKWHGLKDVELRYRQRYLDLLMNEDVRELFEKRSLIVKEIRNFLEENDFTEVETPILQMIAGGASAKPFKTHLNAFDLDVYLRVAPELYLKRLLVGGMDKVYEIGRNFRNEGVDYSHNPEFTMLEFYWAYSDYKEGMKFIEEMLSGLVKKVIGKDKFEYEEKEVDFKTPWERIEFKDLLRKYADINYDDYNFESLKKKAEELGVKMTGDIHSKPQVADQIYKKFCLPNIVNPTFIIHYPSEMLPLAKPLDDNPDYAASFQLVIAGWELVKAYSELNDPVVQREHFEKQEELQKAGDPEAQSMDMDFVEALEHGMPPALGVGIGIDRLTAFLTGAHSLREIILFPTMKPKE